MNSSHLPVDWIVPTWDVTGVGAVLTTRNGGVSGGPYCGGIGSSSAGGLNLGFSTLDLESDVVANRAILQQFLPAAPFWLRQVHGNRVLDLDRAGLDAAHMQDPGSPLIEADAAVTTRRRMVCAIQVADCMPVLFADRAGRVVGAAHAGWRGLAAGVLENTVAAMRVPAQTILAYLGPAIGPRAFEVGDDVYARFTEWDAYASEGFVEKGPGKWWANLDFLARQRLEAIGVRQVISSQRCTVEEPKAFYSYRRDRTTGRMAALIWLD